MKEKNKGNITDRATLRSFFVKGSRPTQEHFEKLIESTFNKAEDIVTSQGSVGNIEGTIPADGKWHNVFEKPLSGFQAYEIVAHAKGNPNEGKYCLLHAIAVSGYGSSHSKISKTCSHYGKWWNKISIRWESRAKAIEEPEKEKWWHNLPFFKGNKQTNQFNLQMKTKSNYGDDKSIVVRISTLYDENL